MKPVISMMLVVAACLPALLLSAVETGNSLPPELEDVGFDQRLGERVPLDLVFTDETGRQAPLGTWFGERPVILALVYFNCPMLCPMILNGLTSALKPMNFDPGKEFEVVVVSFDSRETPEMAAEAKATFVDRYGRPGTESGWHFLTGGEESIAALTETVGFRYSYSPEVDQFAHTAGIVALTPEGQVARYFYGVDYPPKTLRSGVGGGGRQQDRLCRGPGSPLLLPLRSGNRHLHRRGHEHHTPGRPCHRSPARALPADPVEA